LTQPGHENILGHNLGGSVALNAVQEFTDSRYVPDKLAVYDAAVNIDGSIDTGWLDGFEVALNKGKVGHALALQLLQGNRRAAARRSPRQHLRALPQVLPRLHPGRRQ
jgi:hypothetical protein